MLQSEDALNRSSIGTVTLSHRQNCDKTLINLNEDFVIYELTRFLTRNFNLI